MLFLFFSAHGEVVPEPYLTEMSFHFSAQNDPISQVKLPITALVIHAAPTGLAHSKIRTSTSTQLLPASPQPTGRFTHRPAGPSRFRKSASHLEILCINTQNCGSKINPRFARQRRVYIRTGARRLMSTNKDVRLVWLGGGGGVPVSCILM